MPSKSGTRGFLRVGPKDHLGYVFLRTLLRFWVQDDYTCLQDVAQGSVELTCDEHVRNVENISLIDINVKLEEVLESHIDLHLGSPIDLHPFLPALYARPE